MGKIPSLAAIAAAMIWLTPGTASAAWPAPVGHEQPTAQTVPPDDSALGTQRNTERRSVASPNRNSVPRDQLDGGFPVPNICTNCDQ